MEDYLSRDDWAAFSKLGAAAARGMAGGALPRPLYDKLARRGYVSTSPRNATLVTAQGRAALANWQRSLRS